MDRIEASRAEAARLRRQAVSEVTPSRRDFAQYVAGRKDEPTFIARLTLTATGWDRAQLLAHASACDDAEVAALSVSLLGDLTEHDLTAVAAAVTAPILREDPLLDVNQLYHSRLHGTDAVVLPADALEDGELTRLVDVAVSMHMSVVVECNSRASVEAALRWPYTILGVRHLETARELRQFAPATRTMVMLAEIAARHEYEAMRGLCDAVIVGSAVSASANIAAALHILRAQS